MSLEVQVSTIGSLSQFGCALVQIFSSFCPGAMAGCVPSSDRFALHDTGFVLAE
jgi:hypothetical protein